MSTLCQALYTFKIRFKFVNSTRAVTFRAWRCPWLPNEVTGKQGRQEPAQPPGRPPPRWPRPVLAFSALPRGAVAGDGGRLTGRSVPGRRRPWCSGSGSISPSTPWSTTPTEVETRRSPSSKAERPPSRRLPGALSLRRGCAPRLKACVARANRVPRSGSRGAHSPAAAPHPGDFHVRFVFRVGPPQGRRASERAFGLASWKIPSREAEALGEPNSRSA